MEDARRSRRAFSGRRGPPSLWWLTDALALAAAALLGLVAWRAPWDVRRDVPSPRPVTAGELVASGAGYLLLLAVMSWPLARDLAHTGPMDRPDGRLNAWILAWAGPTLFTHPVSALRRAGLPPLEGRARVLREPAAAGSRGGAAAVGLRPRARLQRRARSRACCSPGSASSSWCGARPATGSPRSWRGRSSRPDPTAGRGCRTCTRRSRCSSRSRSSRSTASGSSRTLRRALVVGLMLALQGLSSIYLGAITATALGVAVLVALLGGLKPLELGRLALAMLLAAALLWPVTAPYLRMREFQGQEFTLETVATYAATLPSYVAAGTQFWGGALAAPRRSHDDSRHAVSGPRGAGARHRRARVGAFAVSRRRRGGFGGGGPVLARSRDGVLPLPARAPGADPRGAGARALRARPDARARPCSRASRSRADAGSWWPRRSRS